MKKLFVCAVLFGLVVLPAARAAEKDEDVAIRKRHDEWMAAWNKHDPKLIASFWAEDGDLIDPSGLHAQGRQAIEKFFEERFTGNGMMSGSTYSGTIENIRYIGKSVAIVDVSGQVTGTKNPDGTTGATPKHHVTWVAEKKGGKWMAVAARPCFPHEMPAKPAEATPAPAPSSP